MAIRPEPMLAGDGPGDVSASMAIEAWPSVVFDTNAYYACLGLTHRATKAEIRQAYQDRGGQNSPRMTYVVKQLLNDEIRARYDATSLGTVFFDEEMAEWVYRQATADLSAAREATGGEVETESFDLSHLLNQPYDQVDNSAKRQYLAKGIWQWSYYRWNSNCADTARLSTFRAHIIHAGWEHREACTERESHLPRLAVGYYTGPLPFATTKIGDRWIAFLHEEYYPEEEDYHQLAKQLRKRIETVRTIPITPTNPTTSTTRKVS